MARHLTLKNELTRCRQASAADSLDYVVNTLAGVRDGRACGRDAVSGYLVSEVARHDAVASPVAEVNHEPYQQPNAEPQPVLRGQREHQKQACEYARDGHEGDERRAKRSRGVGV